MLKNVGGRGSGLTVGLASDLEIAQLQLLLPFLSYEDLPFIVALCQCSHRKACLEIFSAKHLMLKNCHHFSVPLFQLWMERIKEVSKNFPFKLCWHPIEGQVLQRAKKFEFSRFFKKD